jgi:hypothetical protein
MSLFYRSQPTKKYIWHKKKYNSALKVPNLLPGYVVCLSSKFDNLGLGNG